MTINKVRRLMLAFALPLLLVAAGCDSGIVDSDAQLDPDAFMIQSIMDTKDLTTMEGAFEASGCIDDRGTYEESLNSAEPLYRLTNLYGTKIFKGTKGTITIEFYVDLNSKDQSTLTANGGFRIVGGNGAYESLQGSGEINMEVARNASPAALTKVLEGQARYVQ